MSAVVPREVRRARSEAEEVIARAKKRADAIVRRAEREAEDLCVAARARGELAGLQRWSKLVRAAEAERASLRESAVDMVIEALRVLHRRDPELQRASVQGVVEELVHLHQSAVDLLVHPDGALDPSRLPPSWRQRADPSLPPDTCLVTAPEQQIDASLSVRLDALRAFIEVS